MSGSPGSKLATLLAVASPRFRLPLPALAPYDRRDLSADVVPAFAMLFLAVPQGLAYATIAGLPPAMDPNLVSAFIEDVDVHRRTAAEVFGIEEGQVDEEQRRIAKAVNFEVVYGQQAFGLAQQLGIPRGQGRQLHSRLLRAPARRRSSLGPMRQSSRTDYETRIHRMLAHIDAHLSEDLPLERLARVASLSPYHFHRIFRTMTGESVSAYVQRRRLESSARRLYADPSATVLEVAIAHGYQNASAFSRAFRGHFGMTATQWRRAEGEARRARLLASRRGPGEERKIGTARDRATWQKISMGSQALPHHAGPQIERIPRVHALGISYVGPYRVEPITEVWRELLGRADELGLIDRETICVGARHDDPSVTEPLFCRYAACVVVPAGTEGKQLASVPSPSWARPTRSSPLGTRPTRSSRTADTCPPARPTSSGTRRAGSSTPSGRASVANSASPWVRGLIPRSMLIGHLTNRSK